MEMGLSTLRELPLTSRIRSTYLNHSSNFWRQLELLTCKHTKYMYLKIRDHTPTWTLCNYVP